MSRVEQSSGRSTSGEEYVPNASATRSIQQKNAMGAPNSAACGPDHEGQRKKRRKSGEVVRAFACQLCTKRYGTRAALSLHFKLKHELPLPLTSWNELQAARDVELAYGPMINDTVEAFVADKHGEMSQRAVVRTAALACILGRAAPNATASSGSGGSHVPHAIGAPGHAVVHAAAADDAAATLYGAGRGGSGSDAESDHKSTHIRKRVRIAEPADGLPFTTDTHPVPIADGHAKMSLPPLAAVLSADVHVRPPSPLSLSMPIAAVPFKLSPPRALPPLQSLVPANASGATAKFQVDVEFFKLPPLISTQSLGETSSPKAGRRSSMVAGEEETALLLVTLGANITDNNNNNNNTNTPTNNANNNNHELQ